MVLAETITLLALYQDEQEKLYQDISSLLTDQRSPVGHRNVSSRWLHADPFEGLRRYALTHAVYGVSSRLC